MSQVLERTRASLDALIANLGLSDASELVERECVPIASTIAERAGRSERCLVVGIAGAQGTGKSTVAALVQTLLQVGFGLRTAIVSLDDYYLPKAARRELARTVHPLLATRGVPGTHDVAALHEALRRLRDLRADDSIELLQFSKADDDRRDETRCVAGPLDVVLFEGWCVGASAEAEPSLRVPLNAFEQVDDQDGRFRRFVNAQLSGAYANLWTELNVFVFLAAPNLDAVRTFRRQQEDKLRLTAAADSSVMDDLQLDRFVEHFERVTRHMLREAPQRADLLVRLDSRRHVVSVESRDATQPGEK